MWLAVVPRSPALARLVTSISYSIGDGDGDGAAPRRERILSNGGADLMVNLHEDEFRTHDADGRVYRVRGAMLSGPRGGHTVIDTAEQRCTVSVSFASGGAAAFFRMPIHDFRELAGITPAACAASVGDEQNHVPLAR